VSIEPIATLAGPSHCLVYRGKPIAYLGACRWVLDAGLMGFSVCLRVRDFNGSRVVHRHGRVDGSVGHLYFAFMAPWAR